MASQKILIESELYLVQYQRGKRNAIAKLVNLWEKPLYYYVRQLVKTEEEAKDVAQEVWLNAIRKIDNLRDPAAFPAWLYKIARNQTASHFRKARPGDRSFDEEAIPESEYATKDEPLPSENIEEIHQALGQLGPSHSECLILHYLEGFSLEEVSDIIGAPIGTVKSRIHYAKKALRTMLSKEESANHE